MKINYNFKNGAFVEILDNPNNKKLYNIKFINQDTNEILFESNINVNHWSKTNIKNKINWKIIIKNNNKIIFDKSINFNDKILIEIIDVYYHNINLYLKYIENFRLLNNIKKIYCYTQYNNMLKYNNKYPNIIFVNNKNYNIIYNINDLYKIELNNKKIDYINIDTTSLGDNIAWLPYIEKYRIKNNIITYVYSKWSDIFIKSYPNLIFINNDNNLKFNKKYILYYFNTVDFNNYTNKKLNINFRTYPVQLIAPIILKLPLNRLYGKIDILNKKNNFHKKYVVIAIQSTLQMKYWNYPNGWEIIIKYLQKNGLKVVLIDKYKSFGIKDHFNQLPKIKGLIDKTGNYNIHDRITDIKNAEFMITISSGLSWIAWALKTKVIMISGFTKPDNEFNTNIIRIHNDNVCNSCWNDISIPDTLRDDWLSCPRNKNFECSKSITPNMVIEAIDKLIKN